MKLKSIILRQSKRSSISSRIDLYGIEEYPPHIIKQRNIILYAHQYNLKIFVETGTYHGDMLEVLKNEFGLLYSVELSHDLFLKAKEKFRKTRHIKLIQGDIVKELALFWLDDTTLEEKQQGEKRNLGLWLFILMQSSKTTKSILGFLFLQKNANSFKLG